ncbi:MAG: SAM-dependent methyltransferase [Clostridia bacterium]|nr:SAM-dependent methyltransferase [Clostridia bacterium]
MSELIYDKMLNIKSNGIREWPKMVTEYNRYEATPYFALEKLFKQIEIKPSDQFVDFGCGLGRVAFYVHNRFNIEVTGLEANLAVFKELQTNNSKYKEIAQNKSAKLNFKYLFAQDYPVDNGDNVFYFFNPFSISIFEAIINNVLKSYEINEREMKIILFYPTLHYQKYLLERTPFELINEVQIFKDNIDYDKFQIYQLS